MSETAPPPLIPPPDGHGPSGRAIAALVLGIVSLIPCCLFLSGVPAIILGRTELAAIRAGRANATGETLARVGSVLGIIGSIFGAALVAMWMLLIALGVFVDGL